MAIMFPWRCLLHRRRVKEEEDDLLFVDDGYCGDEVAVIRSFTSHYANKKNRAGMAFRL